MIDEAQIRDFIRKYQGGVRSFPIDEVCLDVQTIVRGIPFMIVSLKNAVRFERVRNNYNDEIFINQSSISFRKDLKNITEYGRANLKHESIFYGSMFPEDIAFARITNVLETNKILKSGIKDHKGRHVFTTGQWEVSGNLKMVVLPLNEQALKNNFLTRFECEHYLNILNSLPKRDQNLILLLVKFFADEFAKPVDYHEEYKVSAAFTSLFLTVFGFDGIIYPSPKAEYKTYNIALKPTAVKKIDLLKAGIYELMINRTEADMNMLAYAIDLGSKNSQFVWIPAEKKLLSTILKLG